MYRGCPVLGSSEGGGFAFSFRGVRGPCSVGFQADIFVFVAQPLLAVLFIFLFLESHTPGGWMCGKERR